MTIDYAITQQQIHKTCLNSNETQVIMIEVDLKALMTSRGHSSIMQRIFSGNLTPPTHS